MTFQFNGFEFEVRRAYPANPELKEKGYLMCGIALALGLPKQDPIAVISDLSIVFNSRTKALTIASASKTIYRPWLGPENEVGRLYFVSFCPGGGGEDERNDMAKLLLEEATEFYKNIQQQEPSKNLDWDKMPDHIRSAAALAPPKSKHKPKNKDKIDF